MSPRDAAFAYIARGWYVLPVHSVNDGACTCGIANCPSAGKHPRTVHGLNDASIDPIQIAEWFDTWPDSNVGIRTGELSNLTVVDVDVGDGSKPGLINLTRLCAPHGGVPPTYQVRTGSGGLHCYFTYCEALPTGNNVLGEAIDVKSDGGMIVAPPSLHRSGHAYTVVNDGADVHALPDYMRQQRATRRNRNVNKRKTLTLDQAKAALAHIDADDRDRWLNVGLILGRTYAQCEAAWTLYHSWSEGSSKFEEHRAENLGRMREAFYVRSAVPPRRGGDAVTMGSLIKWALDGGWDREQDLSELENFYAIHAAGKLLYVPSGQLWPPQSVDAALPAVEIGLDEVTGEPIYQAASKWLAINRGIESQCFDPALPQINENRVAREQGIIEFSGATMFNRYRPPSLLQGDAREGERWASHVHKLFPDDSEATHIINWIAHRVQQPGQKPRHALLIGGPPGVGKDTIFEAILPALGQWNCAAIAPDQMFASFNEFAAKVFVRISEVVDLHEMNRYKFHEATKTLIAGSPDYIEINPKYGAKYYARNCAGIVMTTNHPTTGLYLPADDRRHFAVETISLWGDDQERAEYFDQLWRWLNCEGGYMHVSAYLHARDLRHFNPDRAPPKTKCFNAIVANGMSGDTWLTDALEQLGNPAIVRADALRAVCRDMTSEAISQRIGPAMARAGYDLLPNPQRRDARHRLLASDGKRVSVVVYVLRGTGSGELAARLADIERF